MTDDSTAEQAWADWAEKPGNIGCSYMHPGFMAGRSSRDAEVAELRGKLIASYSAEHVIALREELAEAQATIEKVRDMAREAQRDLDMHMGMLDAWRVLKLLSAPLSTGGNG